MCFVVSYTLTTLSVTRTVFRTRAIYVIMWTGHGSYIPFLHDFRAKIQLFLTYAREKAILCVFCLSVISRSSLGHRSVLRSSYFTTFKRLFLCSFCELARRTYSSYRPPDAISVRLFRFMFRFCSKWQFPKKRQTGAKPPHRRMAQGRKDYPTHARARKWGIRDARRKFHGKIADKKL